MDLVDSKYIGLVSSRLPKFKRIKPNLYNCRCPICGDSQKQRNKARGYFYAIKANTNYSSTILVLPSLLIIGFGFLRIRKEKNQAEVLKQIYD